MYVYECMYVCVCVYVCMYACMYVRMYVALEEHFRTISLGLWVETNMSVGMDFRVDIRDIRST